MAARLASCEMVATAPPWPVSTGCFAKAPKAAIMTAVARRVRVFMVRSVVLGSMTVARHATENTVEADSRKGICARKAVGGKLWERACPRTER